VADPLTPDPSPPNRGRGGPEVRPRIGRVENREARTPLPMTTRTPTDRYAHPDPKAVDPKNAHPLGPPRGIIRRYVTIEGALAVLLFLAAWFWLAMLIDFGVFKLFAFDWALEAPKALRAIALVLAVAALLALLVTKLVMRLTRDFSDSSLALVLE